MSVRSAATTVTLALALLVPAAPVEWQATAAAATTVDRVFTEPDPIVASAAMASAWAPREPRRRAGTDAEQLRIGVARADLSIDATASSTQAGPLLLVEGGPSGRLATVTRDALRRWIDLTPVRELTIFGGPAAVSSTIEDEIEALGFTVTRAAGEDRIGTSLAVPSTGREHVFLVRADGPGTALWADAAAVGGTFRGKLFATPTDRLDPRVEQRLQELQRSDRPDWIVLLGGTSALSAEVEQAVRPYAQRGVIRLDGAGREATARLLSHAPSFATRPRITLVNPWTPQGWTAALVAAREARLVLYTAADGDLTSETIRRLNDCGTGAFDIDVAGPGAWADVTLQRLAEVRSPAGCRAHRGPLVVQAPTWTVSSTSDSDATTAGIELAAADLTDAGGVFGHPVTVSDRVWFQSATAPDVTAYVSQGTSVTAPAMTTGCSAGAAIEAPAAATARVILPDTTHRLAPKPGPNPTDGAGFPTRAEFWSRFGDGTHNEPSELAQQLADDDEFDGALVHPGDRFVEMLEALVAAGIPPATIVTANSAFDPRDPAPVLSEAAAGMQLVSRPLPPDAFAERVADVLGREPTSTELLTAALAHDCVHAMALGMVASGASNGVLAQPAMDRALDGGQRCNAPDTCLPLARQGVDLDLDGLWGLLGNTDAMRVWTWNGAAWADPRDVVVTTNARLRA